MRILAMLLIASLASATASAQPANTAPASDAVKLFEEGRDLAKAGKWAEACDRFKRSYELDRGVGTELNLADCQEHLGHVAEAWRLFDDAALQSKAQNNPTREKFARDRATALEKKLVSVIVKLPHPDGATVTIAGKSLSPAAEVHDRADPGNVDVVVVTRDGQTFRQTQTAKAGETVTFDAGTTTNATTATTTATSTDTTPPLPPPARSGRKKSYVYLSLGLGVAGVAGLATSAFLGFSARSDYNKVAGDTTLCPMRDPLMCTDPGIAKIHDAQHKANIATGAFVGGAVFLAAGAALYFMAPREHSPDVVLVPTASADGIGMFASGHF